MDGEPSGDRRRVLLAVALLAAMVLGFMSWRTWTSYAIGGVDVTWVGQPDCEGTHLRRDGHTIEWDRDMSCVITVTVRNGGPASVHLRRAVLPYLGVQGGPVVMAAPIGGREPGADPGSGGTHATVALDRTLTSGESWSFDTRIVHRPDGCSGPGTFSVSRWPTVEATYLGRDQRVGGDLRLAIHSSRQNPGCPM